MYAAVARSQSAVATGIQTETQIFYAKALRQTLVKHPLSARRALPTLKKTIEETPWTKPNSAFPMACLEQAFEIEADMRKEAPQRSRNHIADLASACAEEGLISFRGCENINNRLRYARRSRSVGWRAATSTFPLSMAKEMVEQLHSKQFAVVDGIMGPQLSEQAYEHAKCFIEDNVSNFNAGQLESSGTSDQRVRSDYISWLCGSELQPYSMIGGMVQMLQHNVVKKLRMCGLQDTLLLPEAYLSSAMLSVYPPNTGGFVRHTDNSHARDYRALTLIYYPNYDWSSDFGGQLVVYTADTKTTIEPKRDRLVALWSHGVEHEVLPIHQEAPERIALSYWCMGPEAAVEYAPGALP